MVPSATAARTSVTALMVGEAVEVTHIQEEEVATATTAADVWWVGGTKKCERPEAAAHFLIF
jgi:hypothetical protein